MTSGTPEIEPGRAVLVEWTADQYHGDATCTSRSALEELRSRPALYYARYVSRVVQPDPPSAAMQLGTNVHLCLLEPDEWARRVYPRRPDRPPHASGTAKRSSPEYKAYSDWKAEVAAWESGKQDDSIVLDGADRERVELMASSVRSHPYASTLLDGDGANEQTILWRHAETGVVIRVRVDRLRYLDETTYVVMDAKTTADDSPRSFGASCARYGYHRQGAIYVDAVRALYPDVDVHYALAVVRSTPPYETAVYELDDAGGFDSSPLDLGRRQYENTLRELVRRRAENDWLAPWQRGCAALDMPGWAYMED